MSSISRSKLQSAQRADIGGAVLVALFLVALF
jgi:hypothetical protein